MWIVLPLGSMRSDSLFLPVFRLGISLIDKIQTLTDASSSIACYSLKVLGKGLFQLLNML